jgi:hypothetical protein
MHDMHTTTFKVESSAQVLSCKLKFFRALSPTLYLYTMIPVVSTLQKGRHDIQHDDTQHSSTQHNDIQQK